MEDNKIYRKILEEVWNVGKLEKQVDLEDVVKYSGLNVMDFVPLVKHLDKRGMIRVPMKSTGVIDHRIRARLTEFGYNVLMDDLDKEFPLEKEVDGLSAGSPKTKSKLDIFVSHSNVDEALVREIVDLLQSTLRLDPKRIRCTSLDGYGFKVGADVDETIKSEVFDATIVIALLSTAALESVYVLFELGARWAKGGLLFPLVTPEVEIDETGPISALNALHIDSDAQVIQLIEDVADSLGLDRPSAGHYLERAKELSALARTYLTTTDPVTAPILSPIDISQLSEKEKEILLAARVDPDIVLIQVNESSYPILNAGGKILSASDDPLQMSEYVEALESLCMRGLAKKVESALFALTSKGLKLARELGMEQ